MVMIRWFSVLSVAILGAGICGAAEPKESWITFLSRRSGENRVYRMRPDGSAVTPIFGGELKDIPGLAEGEALYREPHWARQSPDRKFFLDWAWDVKQPRDKFILPRFMIYLGRLNGGPVRVIASDGGEYFAWSPDSKKFAYSRSWQFPSQKGGYISSPTQIIILGIDGAGEKIILEKPFPQVWKILDWSPDGKKLLIEHRTTVDMLRARSRLYELDLVAADARRARKPVDRDRGQSDDPHDDSSLKTVLDDPSRWVLDGKYSPDGNTIAALIEPMPAKFQGANYPGADLVTIAVSTRKQTTVVHYPGEKLWAPLCWSPTGQEILFSRTLKPDDRREEMGPGEPGWGIWAIQTDGTNIRFVTTGWCPDWR